MKQATRSTHLIRRMALCLLCVCLLTGCGGNEKKEGYQKNTSLQTNEKIVLTIGTRKETWPEMDAIAAKFQAIYPNCSVVCEFIEGYTNNLPVRLSQQEDKIDIFATVNIQESSTVKDYALNLISAEAKKTLDLSGTNAGILDNFKYIAAPDTQYAIPYGGEMRGMYVNVTLLKKLGLSTPKNRAELLASCETLLKNGYIPLQSAPGTFSQQLLYPSICNRIVNGGSYEATYAAIENIDEGVSAIFRDEYALLYEIVEKGYYDYSRVESELGYTFNSSDSKAYDFLNIKKVDEDTYEKQDDIGKIAFMVDTQGFDQYLTKVKADYHSKIEYAFILSPVGEAGGYAYLSPSDGLAINKSSDHTDWALEFLNFFFTPEMATTFADATGKIPNTKDALLKYSVPEDHSCSVGQVTFSYPFYKTVTTLMMGGYEDMIGISKMNAPDNMRDNGDGTYSLPYTLDEYMARLEQEFQAAKNARAAAQ